MIFLASKQICFDGDPETTEEFSSTINDETTEEPEIPDDPTLSGTNFTIDNDIRSKQIENYIKNQLPTHFYIILNNGVSFNMPQGTGYGYSITSQTLNSSTLTYSEAPSKLFLNNCSIIISNSDGVIGVGELINVTQSTISLNFMELTVDTTSAPGAKSSKVHDIIRIIDAETEKFIFVDLPLISSNTSVSYYIGSYTIVILRQFISFRDKNMIFKGFDGEILGPKELILEFVDALNIQTSSIELDQGVRRLALSESTQGIIPIKSNLPEESIVRIGNHDLNLSTALYCNGRFHLHLNSTITLKMNSTSQAIIDAVNYQKILNIANIQIGEFLASTFNGKYYNATYKEGGVEMGGILLSNAKILNTNINKPLLLIYNGGTTQTKIIADDNTLLKFDKSFAKCSSSIHIIIDGNATISADSGVDLHKLLNITTSTGTTRDINQFLKANDEPDPWYIEYQLYIIIGAGALVIIITLLICCCCCCKRKDRDSSSSSYSGKNRKSSKIKSKKSKIDKKSKMAHKSKRKTRDYSDDYYSMSSESSKPKSAKISKNARKVSRR